MSRPGRWPLHPAPSDGESLSSWLARIAALYRMTVGQLLEHGLGHDPEVQSELDRDPPAALLAALELRTGVSVERAAQMCLAGWIPWLLDSVQAHPESFDTSVRQFSVLLGPGTRSRHRAERWRAWVSADRLHRACPQCLQDPARPGLRLIWQLPLTLSCPEHGLILQACAGDPGGVFVWIGETEPRRASPPVLSMDRRTEQALSAGRVELPGRAVHAGVWLRVLRTLIDEVSTAGGYWRPHDADLRRIWQSAGHPVRAGIPAWRPYEKLSWPIQAQLLDAAAHAINLLEDGTVRGRGTHADLFFAIYEPVDDGHPPTATRKDPHVQRGDQADPYTQRWDQAMVSLEAAIQAARADPAEAQRLYRFLLYPCRAGSVERARSILARLGIPTDALSHNDELEFVPVT